jgi:hypothetical protein
MANVIKYIYTSIPANTVQVFPFVIGVNFGGYGSTAATGFWNGKTPNVGGYVVYVSVSPPSSPTIYVADNDTQLINLCNQLFGTGVSTVGAALQTFNGSSSTCCVNVDYPNIVTTNIGPNLDASYTPSYPRTGTSWTDISGSLYNGTLVNGVTYGSDALTFDGTDDAVTLPSTITLGNGSWSVGMWVSAGSFNSDYGKLLSNNSGGPVSNAMGVTNGKISYQYYLSSWNQQLGSTSLTAGDWYYLTWVNNSNQMIMYVNGVADSALFTSTTNNGGPVNSIGRNWFSTFPGKISNVAIYQGKSLTSTEILQNYYAGLQRFIPTTLLVLYLDGNNTNKQVMTASTANDISGNNNNGTLMNGVTLVRDGQRSFSFDGTNDYIDLGSSTLLSTATTNITVSIWFKYTTTPVGGYTLIKFGAASSGWLLGFSSAGIYFQLYTTVTSFAGGGYSVSLNTWNNVTFTFNGPTYTLYINGSSPYSATSTSGTITNGGSNLINIGRDGSGNTNFFTGNISVVRGYNQTLTAAQVLTIYNAGKQRYGL